MMTAYYNEIDPYAAQWLRNLIAADHIAPGDVDERSISDVRPDDVRPYRQCHFFAGIGGWSLALRLAGWDDSDSRSVWTGSCPCTPFSTAGKGTGGKDSRHLWPHWFRLIRECRPRIVFGENVEAAIGWGWLDAVLGDLEAEGYATGAAVLGAHSVGAPHVRARLWFVADACGAEWRADVERGEGDQRRDRSEARPQRNDSERQLGAIDEHGQPFGNDGSLASELANAMPTRRPKGWAIAGDGSASSGSIAGELADAQRGTAERWRHDMAGAASQSESEAWKRQRLRSDARAGEPAGELADAGRDRSYEGRRLPPENGTVEGGAGRWVWCEPSNGGASSLMGATDWTGSQGRCLNAGEHASQRAARPANQSGIVGNAASDGQSRLAGTGERRPVALGGSGAWRDLVWLPCTDGKARPTRTRLQYVFDGLPPGMAIVCARQDKEEIDGTASEARSNQALYGLRSPSGAEEIPDLSGGHGRIPSSQILRSSLHGEGARERNLPQRVSLARKGTSDDEADMRSVWEHGEKACSSHRWQSSQQYPLEFDDFVQLLPSAYPLAQLCGDSRTAEAVQILLKIIDKTGALSHTSDARSQVWRSALDQNQNWLRVVFDEGGWVMEHLHPLSCGVPARVGKLRAAGNAIVPQVAAEFIKACMDKHGPRPV